MHEETIVFIVEGAKRELQILESVNKSLFKHSKIQIVTLPTELNIYMLWQKLKKDKFETDIIEVIREQNDNCAQQLKNLRRDDISEIYLLFDYDEQHKEHLPANTTIESVLKKMLTVFDNETENGKLYISYPMIEALRDYQDNQCKAASSCICKTNECENYKMDSSKNSKHNDIT